MSLEPIQPETAIELYLADRKNELAEASVEAHEYRLNHLVRWCEQEEIENLNELTGRRFQRYRLWRHEEGDLNKVGEKTQMDTVRVFVRWLESIDGVEPDLSTKVRSPAVTPDENSGDVILDTDRASEVLSYCEKYAYASIEHVALSLMWHTMMRTGAVHALDVDDYHPEEQYLEVRHRPKTGTPIKNKDGGERLVAISEHVCDLLDDWITDQRQEVRDEYDRDPLLTTQYGRVHKSTIRDYVYRFTRPCVYSDTCPHDRNPKECPAMESNSAAACPSSVSPHAIRRGSITHSLNNEMPDKVVSDRANVSQVIIDEHYDRRTEREKMEQRRGYLDYL
jgi:integrase